MYRTLKEIKILFAKKLGGAVARLFARCLDFTIHMTGFCQLGNGESSFMGKTLACIN